MSKKKNSQKKLVNELKTQLLVQAERLGIRDDYSPVYFEEIKLDSVKKILTEFYMERSNLEYEMQTLEANKKEILIKLERLHAYIRKAVGLHERHLKDYEKLIDSGTGDQEMTRRAVKQLQSVRVQAAC